MPTTPFAVATVSKNGGVAASGGITIAAGDDIQFSATNKAGWVNARWEVIGPEDWVVPAGWTDESGVFVYEGGTEDPPEWTAPAITVWGKWMLTLIVNNGSKNGEAGHVDMTDTATALSMLSGNGVEGVGVRESTQFSTLRSWARIFNGFGQLIHDALNAAGVVTWGGDLDPTSTNTNQIVRKLTGAAGVIVSTATALRTAAGTAFGFGSNGATQVVCSAAGALSCLASASQAATFGGNNAAQLTCSSAGEVTLKSPAGQAAVFGGNNGSQLSITSTGITTLQANSGQDTNVYAGGVGNAVLYAGGTGAVRLIGRTRLHATTVAAGATLAVDEHLTLVCDTSGAAITITLPTPVNGRTLIITHQGPVANFVVITLARSGSEKINNVAASYTLPAGMMALVTTNGTDWFVGTMTG